MLTSLIPFQSFLSTDSTNPAFAVFLSDSHFLQTIHLDPLIASVTVLQAGFHVDKELICFISTACLPDTDDRGS